MDTSYDVAMSGTETYEWLGCYGLNFIRNEQTYDHAIIGSPHSGPFTPPDLFPGTIFIFFGGRYMDSIPDLVMIGRTDSSWLGYHTANAGFTTSRFDGSDLIAGAPVEHNSRGTAYIWLGGSDLDTIPDAWIRGVQYDDAIGWGVASAGDIDGDGRDEVMVCNYASDYTPERVGVCKYTGVGVEEKWQMRNAK
jgi:hypothetical protein